MNFFGVLMSLVAIGVLIWFVYVICKDVICPIYKETFLKKKYTKDLFNKVSWIIDKSSSIRNDDLVNYIEREQYNLKVENNCCIDFSNESEKSFVCEIIETHKQFISDSFFCDSLTKDKFFYNLDCLEYYMFSLRGFLEKKQLETNKFNDIVLYRFFSKEGSYTTHKLTDDGVLYKKLFYITTLFCVNNEKINPSFTNPKSTLKSIKENLEKKEISFWSYRP